MDNLGQAWMPAEQQAQYHQSPHARIPQLTSRLHSFR